MIFDQIRLIIPKSRSREIGDNHVFLLPTRLLYANYLSETKLAHSSETWLYFVISYIWFAYAHQILSSSISVFIGYAFLWCLAKQNLDNISLYDEHHWYKYNSTVLRNVIKTNQYLVSIKIITRVSGMSEDWLTFGEYQEHNKSIRKTMKSKHWVNMYDAAWCG